MKNAVNLNRTIKRLPNDYTKVPLFYCLTISSILRAIKKIQKVSLQI